MSDDFLGERRHSLEEKFFHSREKQLLDRLRKEHEVESTRAALKATTGIDDQSLLNEVAALGIRAETLACLSLVPLVAVAWADGRIEADERKAILESAVTAGLQVGSPAYELLDSWLVNKPGEDLIAAWVDYVKALGEKLNRNELEKLKIEIVGRAIMVAEAAGGYFGLGKVSAPEKAVIETIEKAFG